MPEFDGTTESARTPGEHDLLVGPATGIDSTQSAFDALPTFVIPESGPRRRQSAGSAQPLKPGARKSLALR